MARVYADMIKNHKINPKTNTAWTINDVPQRYKAEVQRILDED